MGHIRPIFLEIGFPEIEHHAQLASNKKLVKRILAEREHDS